MKGLACLAMVAVCGALLAQENKGSAKNTGSARWASLFDGKSLNGWHPENDAKWIAVSGALVSDQSGDGWLRSDKTYTNFVLKLQYRNSPKGNSGLKYRIQDHVFLMGRQAPRFEDNVNAALKNRPTERPARGQDYVIGFEYQMTDNAANSDALQNGSLHQTAALYDIEPPTKDATKPVGEFNHSRLVVKGNHVEHWLNGVKVVDTSLKGPEVVKSMAKRWGESGPVYDLLVNQPVKECHISLQNHGDEAWFKNIKIRKL
jgi:hypothetical protein